MTANQPEDLSVLEEEMNNWKAHFLPVILQLACITSLTVQYTASSGPFSTCPVMLFLDNLCSFKFFFMEANAHFCIYLFFVPKLAVKYHSYSNLASSPHKQTFITDLIRKQSVACEITYTEFLS